MPGEVGDVGFKQAMQHKWVALDKSGGQPLVVRKVECIVDRAAQVLGAVAAAGGSSDGLAAADLDALKKRKLIKPE